jgi:hypothetical protein
MTRLIAAFLITLGTLAAQTQVMIHDDRPFPESLTSTADGSLYFGSTTKGIVYRSAPGAAMAEPWITAGLQNVLGVLADEKSNTMWVCSNQTPSGEPNCVEGFRPEVRRRKESYTFTGGTELCNDIAMGVDGSAYATETRGSRVLKRKPGAAALEVWAKDDQLAAADGLAFSDASTLVVNTYGSGHLVKIPVSADGSAGAVTLLPLSQPLVRPTGCAFRARTR